MLRVFTGSLESESIRKSCTIKGPSEVEHHIVRLTVLISMVNWCPYWPYDYLDISLVSTHWERVFISSHLICRLSIASFSPLPEEPAPFLIVCKWWCCLWWRWCHKTSIGEVRSLSITILQALHLCTHHSPLITTTTTIIVPDTRQILYSHQYMRKAHISISRHAVHYNQYLRHYLEKGSVCLMPVHEADSLLAGFQTKKLHHALFTQEAHNLKAGSQHPQLHHQQHEIPACILFQA